MSETIGVKPSTIDQLVRQAGRTAEVPEGVGKLRIRPAGGMGVLGLNSIYVEGKLGNVTLKEKLCMDEHFVTYESGSFDNGGELNLVLLGALETIADIENSTLRIPTPISTEACQALAVAGYVQKSAHNRSYFVKKP